MNSQEMKIRLINGSLFQLIGSDNIDSLMGTNPKIVVFSEYAMQNPAAWEYIKPIITVNKGHAIFISTPRGKNHFWELMRTAKTTEGWYCQINTINDTNVLTEEDMKKERDDGVSEEHIQQEYYCSFERGIEGSYYSSLINKMRDQNRIMPLCYDPHKLVNTSWDLGWNDFTGIIFFQMHGSQIHIFDFLEYGTTTFALIKDILDKKGYRYGIHLFPHDVENVDGQGTGCTRKEILENLKIPVTNVPRHLVHEGIEAVKVLLSSRIYIDNKKCERLISCLEYYHREWNEKHKVYGNKPIHDWSSHLSDAMRYLAMGLNLLEESNSDNEKALQNYFR